MASTRGRTVAPYPRQKRVFETSSRQWGRPALRTRPSGAAAAHSSAVHLPTRLTGCRLSGVLGSTGPATAASASLQENADEDDEAEQDA